MPQKAAVLACWYFCSDGLWGRRHCFSAGSLRRLQLRIRGRSRTSRTAQIFFRHPHHFSFRSSLGADGIEIAFAFPEVPSSSIDANKPSLANLEAWSGRGRHLQSEALFLTVGQIGHVYRVRGPIADIHP